MTNPLASVLQSAAAPAAATAAPAKAISQADFLKLFIAQLQHQDPLSPLQPDQMTAQLAQFASLEQLTGVNTRLDQLTGVSRNSVLGLIGKQIRFAGGQLSITNGQAPPARYTLADRAGEVTATVRAADGTVVRVVKLGAQDKGERVFQFDGKNDAGTALPDGTYRIEISATGTDKTTPVAADLAVQDTVDGVDFSVDPPVVLVGSLRIPLDQVREVHLGGAQAGQGS